MVCRLLLFMASALALAQPPASVSLRGLDEYTLAQAVSEALDKNLGLLAE